jgi:hypothetical protein
MAQPSSASWCDFERHQVVRSQPFQAIGQSTGEAAAAAADDQHVEQLLLHRQVTLDIDHEGRAGEEVGQEQPEESVPVAQWLALDSHRRALPGSIMPDCTPQPTFVEGVRKRLDWSIPPTIIGTWMNAVQIRNPTT